MIYPCIELKIFSYRYCVELLQYIIEDGKNHSNYRDICD